MTTPGPDLPSTKETLGAQGLLGCLILFAVWLYQLAPFPNTKHLVVYLVYPLSYILESFHGTNKSPNWKETHLDIVWSLEGGSHRNSGIGRYTIEKLYIYAPPNIYCLCKVVRMVNYKSNTIPYISSTFVFSYWLKDSAPGFSNRNQAAAVLFCALSPSIETYPQQF